MPSLDNIYDLTERLSEEGIEYVVITVQKGKKEHRCDVMLDLSSDDTTLAACAVIEHLHQSLMGDIDIAGEEFSLDIVSDSEFPSVFDFSPEDEDEDEDEDEK
jgi:hypothetical protein